MKNAFFVLLAALSAASAGWRALNPRVPGVMGEVTCTARSSDGTLYLGGSLKAAGDVTGSGVFAYRNGAWKNLGSGVRTVYGRTSRLAVNAMVVDGKGRLYVGGFFDSAGDVAARNVAMWDGTKWNALGTGPDSAISSLAIDSTGALLASSVTGSTGVRRWNGTTWTQAFPAPSAYALAVDTSGALFAGGTFTDLDSSKANAFARIHNSLWIPVGMGAMSGDLTAKTVYHLAATSDGAVWAAGRFDSGKSQSVHNLARWNGSKLAGCSTGSGDQILALESDGGTGVFVGGAFSPSNGIVIPGITPPSTRTGPAHVAHCSGATCQSMGSGTDAYVTALGRADDGSLIVAGPFQNAGGVHVSGLARWSDSSWSGFSPGLDGQILATLPDPSGGWIAGGLFRFTPSGYAPHVARFDGAVWSTLGDGLPGSVTALARAKDGTILAMSSVAKDSTKLFRWNGTRWDSLGQRLYGAGNELAIDASGTIWLRTTRLWRWSGTGWSEQWIGSSVTLKALLAMPDSGIAVAGTFSKAGEVTVNNVARFDGTKWNAFGTGTNSDVEAATLDRDGRIVALSSVGGSQTLGIVRFDGKTWTTVPSVPKQFIPYSVAIDASNRIYAWGWCDTLRMGSTLWMRDSTGWNLITQEDATLRIFADKSNTGVAVSGDFATFGGVGSPWFASWVPGSNVSTAPSHRPVPLDAARSRNHRVDGSIATPKDSRLDRIRLK